MPDNFKQQQRREDQRTWLVGLLVSAQNRNWFGKITIEVKRGEIDKVLSEESLKPPEKS